MRIGLLTVPFNNNFGGFLQAYALKHVLIEFGHDVIIINRRRNRKWGLKGKVKYTFEKIGIYKSTDKRLSVNTKKFIKRYLTPGTPYYYTSKGLRKCLEYGFDYCIVGSDQVWRYKYAKDSIDDFFFSFLEATNIPRISYAASFGIDSLEEYPDDKRSKCGKLLRSFAQISVREISGVRLVNELGDKRKNIKVVLDPTLLLSKEHYYDNIIKYRYIDMQFEKYVFNYILDETEEENQITTLVAQSIGHKVIKLKAQTGDMKEVNQIAPVEEWLSRIYYADYVVTDSFHGTVFSILFNKPFIVLGNTSRGLTRFQSLLKIFNLESQMILSLNDFNECLLNHQIDWCKVNSILNNQRTHSLSYLQEALQVKNQ